MANLRLGTLTCRLYRDERDCTTGGHRLNMGWIARSGVSGVTSAAWLPAIQLDDSPAVNASSSCFFALATPITVSAPP
jgi:hypothetical protein